MRVYWIIVLFLFTASCSRVGEAPLTTDAQVAARVRLPEGFEIRIFARGLLGPRFMTLGPDGNLYVSLPRSGSVVRLTDMDRDGRADRLDRVVEDLDRPHGLAFWQGKLYVAGTEKIWRVDRFRENETKQEVTAIVQGLPDGGRGHWTRTILFGDDRKLYVSVGSSCNVCKEKDPRRAAIVRYDADGTGEEIFASGLRNSVGIAWHPFTRELWGTDNGRDWLGDDLPPEEINIIRQRKNYGWPYCFGNRIPDPDFGSTERCRRTEPPIVTIPAHSAPLGLTFYTAKHFPPEYRGNIFVALHGSWNRSKKIGYKIVRIRFDQGRPTRVEDFATGWLQIEDDKEIVWGRPVDLLVAPDGGLLLSDDDAGLIYRIRYRGKP